MICDRCGNDVEFVDDYLYVDDDNNLHKHDLCDSCAVSVGFNPQLSRSIVEEFNNAVSLDDFIYGHNHSESE